MIPRRAIFYWEGEEPSWLRRQSWETFSRLNPGWEIAVISAEPETHDRLPGTSRLAIALRSDLERYKALFEEGGGYYFDTDIIFFRPFPDAWRDADVALTLTEEGFPAHIGMLGSAPKGPLFAEIIAMAEKRIASSDPLGYQSLGMNLLDGWRVTKWCDERGIKWYPLPLRAIMGTSWRRPEMAWGAAVGNAGHRPGAIGLHWYGNDHLSRELEPAATVETLKGTVIGRALGL